MTVTLSNEQILTVQRYMAPLDHRRQKRFVHALRQILAREPGRDYVIAMIALALDAVIAEEKTDQTANAGNGRDHKETPRV